MGETVEALKALAVAMGCAINVKDIKTITAPETIKFIADNYPSGLGSKE